jgi:hypothetical protein
MGPQTTRTDRNADDPGIAANNIRCHYTPKGAAAPPSRRNYLLLLPQTWIVDVITIAALFPYF